MNSISIKYLTSIVAVVMLAMGCNQASVKPSPQVINLDSIKTVLINADKSFSELSQQKGFYHSRLDFVAENAVEMGSGSMPLEGKKAIEAFSASNSDSSFKLEWKAVRAEVAESGELGYTFGGWTMKTKTKTGKDTILYGNYITIWHKQPDGSWKYILDGGGDTPKPVTQ